MELFLLLSMGLSIVAFISIALTKAPAAKAITDHNLEPAFPLESTLSDTQRAQMLKLEDQTIQQSFDVKGNQRSVALYPTQPSSKEQQMLAVTAS